MIIYNNVGNKVLEIEVDDNSYRNRAVMGDHSLTLYYSLPEHVEIPVGSYCEFQGETFTLKRPENFKMKHKRLFEYTVLFDPPEANAKVWKFRNPVDGRLKFSLTAKPHEHLQMFVDNMNRRDKGWTVGECIDGVETLIAYDHDFCIDALTRMASTFKTEYEFTGKRVSLRKIEYNKSNPLPLSYGRGNGFKPGVGRSNTGDNPPTEILFVQGGTDNIDPSKYGSSELLLPKNQTLAYDGEHFEDEDGFIAKNARRYVVDEAGLSIRRDDKQLSSLAEDSLDCSEIYPKRVGTVSTVVAVDEKNNFYDIVDTSIPSSLNYEECLIAGETMTVVFQTGMLAGREFEVKYYHNAVKGKAARRFEIVPADIDGQTMPNTTFAPKSGDKYAVFKCMLPTAYICDNATKTGASWDMFRAAVKHLFDNEDLKFTFTGELDGIWSKKDWDAMYVQCPRTYLMMNMDENEINFEKSLYNVMLSLMMLYERGCLSKNEIASWLCKALSNNFWFGDKNNPGIARDKAEWAQTIIEQAVGRLCRTRNKPQTTYILYDKDINCFFDKVNLKKSLTKEFRSLVSYILEDEQKTIDSNINNDEIIRCNNANYAKRQLDRMRNIALRYTPKLGKEDYFDDENEDINTVPYNVMINQKMNQSYKQTIIRKPVVSDFNELEDSDKNLSFIHKCYGDWKRNNENEIFFHYDPKHNNYFCPATKGKPGQFPVSPQSVRLDVLMKNEVIRLYFEQNGFATNWETKGMILHPDILMTDYAGEIGEEAFKAIVLHYTNCKENEIKHLEGRDYELADFVICNPDGSYKIAFDVKNMNPDIDHDDKPGELPTKEKRAIKRKRLGCQLITVSMLQLSKEPMGDITEIHGIIDDNGKIIESAIETLKLLID